MDTEKQTHVTAGKLSRDYFRAVVTARAFKADRSTKREKGVRLYSTQFGSAWELQVRCPLGIGYFGLRDGKDFVIAWSLPGGRGNEGTARTPSLRC